MKKKTLLRRLVTGVLVALAVVLMATWALWMRTPSGAVRNEILINGHPIKAIVATPTYDRAASKTFKKQIYSVPYAQGYVVSDGSYRVTLFRISGGGGLYAAREQADTVK